MADQSILIVDDDRELRDLIVQFLSEHGYRTAQATDVPAMRGILARSKPDLIILDLMMPGEDGLAALRTMDPHDRPPVIMLSAMGSDVDRIVGLEMGADDYLAKPCNPRELLARVRAVLRRNVGDVARQAKYRFGGLEFDAATRELRQPTGELVDLTTNEFRLLEIFLLADRRVLSRDELSRRLKGDHYEEFDRAIDLAISRLRRKLGIAGVPDAIRTVRGEGYGLGPAVERA